MRRFQTVLFDLDGTLIDSIDLIIDSYLHTFGAHGVTPPSRTDVLAGIGTPLRAVFAPHVADEPAMLRWIATYREFNLAHHDARVRVYPGVVDLVKGIRAAGMRTGLVTSKNHSGARRGLAFVGLENDMEVVVGADDVVHPKPHPEPVLRALELLDMPASTCLFVGDSHHDVHCGKAAGVATAGVTWGPFDRAHLEVACPDHYCATPEELRAVTGC
jgi:pyrophosphatase PpaX